MSETVIPLTKHNLPRGNRWERDGACWQAVLDDRELSGWRWQPMNQKVLAKAAPEGGMTDHVPMPQSEIDRLTLSFASMDKIGKVE